MMESLNVFAVHLQDPVADVELATPLCGTALNDPTCR